MRKIHSPAPAYRLSAMAANLAMARPSFASALFAGFGAAFAPVAPAPEPRLAALPPFSGRLARLPAAVSASRPPLVLAARTVRPPFAGRSARRRVPAGMIPNFICNDTD